MPVSGSWDFILVQQDIIKAALRKVKAIPPGGDAPSTAMESEASLALNSMVMSWQNEGIFLWALASDTLNLTAGVADYDISNVKVIGIQNCFIRVDGYDYPIRVITRDEYMSIPEKSLQARPEQVYLHRELAKSTLTFWYVPDTNYTLRYTTIVRLQDMDEMTNNPDFPVEWSEALIYGLAYALAPDYDLPVEEQDRLRRDAREKKNIAFLGSKEVGNLRVTPRRRQ